MSTVQCITCSIIFADGGIVLAIGLAVVPLFSTEDAAPAVVPEGYEGTEIEFPVLHGSRLQFAAWLVNLPIVSGWLRAQSLRRNNLHHVTALAAQLGTQPTFYPLHAPTPAERLL